MKKCPSCGVGLALTFVFKGYTYNEWQAPWVGRIDPESPGPQKSSPNERLGARVKSCLAPSRSQTLAEHTPRRLCLDHRGTSAEGALSMRQLAGTRTGLARAWSD